MQSKTKQPVTAESLRTFPGLEELTDAQVAEAVTTLQKLAIILLDAVKNAEINQHENP